jgi:hypothetical protein
MANCKPGHDQFCEWDTLGSLCMGGLPAKTYKKEECHCAIRAYERDPLPELFDIKKDHEEM